MRSICDTAPEAAQDFAKAILEISDMGATESATNPSTRERSTTRNLSYRPPRSARIAEKSDSSPQADINHVKRWSREPCDTLDCLRFCTALFVHSYQVPLPFGRKRRKIVLYLLPLSRIQNDSLCRAEALPLSAKY